MLTGKTQIEQVREQTLSPWVTGEGASGVKERGSTILERN